MSEDFKIRKKEALRGKELWKSTDSDIVLEPVEEGVYLIPILKQEVREFFLAQVEELLEQGRKTIEETHS